MDTMTAGPALTSEEWERGAIEDQDGQTVGEEAGQLWAHAPLDHAAILLDRRHATAALALHGQPFGFTWEDVDALNAAVKAIESEIRADSLRSQMQAPPNAFIGDLGNQLRGLPQRAARLRSAARRIEALLPPR